MPSITDEFGILLDIPEIPDELNELMGGSDSLEGYPVEGSTSMEDILGLSSLPSSSSSPSRSHSSSEHSFIPLGMETVDLGDTSNTPTFSSGARPGQGPHNPEIAGGYPDRQNESVTNFSVTPQGMETLEAAIREAKAKLQLMHEHGERPTRFATLFRLQDVPSDTGPNGNRPSRKLVFGGIGDWKGQIKSEAGTPPSGSGYMKGGIYSGTPFPSSSPTQPGNVPPVPDEGSYHSHVPDSGERVTSESVMSGISVPEERFEEDIFFVK
jgi:hypothetical protein